MPFEVSVDADEVLKKFDELQERVTGLERQLPNTFMDWQREDMNRKFPKVEGGDNTFWTRIFPRGRLQRRAKGGGGRATRRRVRAAARRPGAHRPILRPELFDQLRVRMVAMCEAALKWH